MPSTVHNVIVELIEAHPDVLEYLLELHGLSLSGPLLPAPDTLAKTVAVERRVDRVFVIGPRHRPESFLLTEVQLDADDKKRFAWALYMQCCSLKRLAALPGGNGPGDGLADLTFSSGRARHRTRWK